MEQVLVRRNTPTMHLRIKIQPPINVDQSRRKTRNTSLSPANSQPIKNTASRHEQLYKLLSAAFYPGSIDFRKSSRSSLPLYWFVARHRAPMRTMSDERVQEGGEWRAASLERGEIKSTGREGKRGDERKTRNEGGGKRNKQKKKRKTTVCGRGIKKAERGKPRGRRRTSRLEAGMPVRGSVAS